MEPTGNTPHVVSQYYLKIQALSTDTQNTVQTTTPSQSANWIPYDPSTALYIFISLVLVGSLALLITRARQLNKLLMVLAVSFVTSAIPLALNLTQQRTAIESKANVEYTPTEVVITGVTATGFDITWHTDKPQTGAVRIALDKAMTENSRVITATDLQITTDHFISINQLEPGTNYYLEVLSGADWYNLNGEPLLIATTAR